MGSLPVSEITQIVGAENVLTDLEDRYCYGYDASRLPAVPECVALPGSVEQVAELLKLANRDRFPVFPRGAASGTGVGMDWRERIGGDPAVCHGKACIRGTRVMVSVIIDNLAAGETPETADRDYRLTLDDVRAALLYAGELARESIVTLPPSAV